MATTNFPTSLDTISSLPNPGSGDITTAPSHASQHDVENDAIRAIEAKIGVGASTPTANKVLRATGTGTTAYAQVGLTTDVTGTLPVANGGTGTTALGSGVATFLGTPSSANLASAVTDETGTGVLVFNNTPTIIGGGSWAGSPTITSPLLISPTESGTVSGWIDGLPVPNSITYNGNGSYSLIFSGTDITGTVSPGMRLKTTRSVAAPTQCTSLNGSTQYYSKSSPAGLTGVTGNHTYLIAIKPPAYPSSAAGLISHDSSTSAGSGFELQLTTTGQIAVFWRNASGNSSFTSVQSIPLNQWSTIAVSCTTATPTVAMYLNGASIPFTVGASAATSVVQPSASLYIGNRTGSSSGFFQGKIAQAAFFSAALSQATIQSYYSQGLLGTESSSVSAYSFNNTINDLNTTNANNLTANGSAIATTVDAPWTQQANGIPSGTTDFGIIHSAAFSTDTTMVVQVPEGCAIPTSGGVSAVSYSTQKVPYGFPSQKGKWRIASLLISASITSNNSTFGAFINNGWALAVPIGEWTVGWMGNAANPTISVVYFNLSRTALTGLSQTAAFAISRFQSPVISSASATVVNFINISQPQSLSTQQTYIMYSFGTPTTAAISGLDGTCEIFAENAYL